MQNDNKKQQADTKSVLKRNDRPRKKETIKVKTKKKYISVKKGETLVPVEIAFCFDIKACDVEKFLISLQNWANQWD